MKKLLCETLTAAEFGDLSVAEVKFRNCMLTGTVKLVKSASGMAARLQWAD